MIFVFGCAADSGRSGVGDLSGAPPSSSTESHAGFTRTDLVSDQEGAALRVDADLVNAWGVAVDEDGLFWVADNATGKLSIYDRDGTPAHGEYVSGAIDLGEGIDGIVANDTKTFEMHGTLGCAPAQFIVASESGMLIGVNPDVEPRAGVPLVDRSMAGAIYKGVAIVESDAGPQLLAADFHNARIDVFDERFGLIDESARFVDPELPAHYAPFNVAVIGDQVLVAFAEQDADAVDEISGAGLGVISVFDRDGGFVRRLVTAGALNAPWAMTLAPVAFCGLSSQLLVGNFGDGRITAYSLDSGKMIEQLADQAGLPIAVDGLWGLATLPDALFFAAGPDDEAHGLFGRIAPQ